MKKVSLILSAVVMAAMMVSSCGGDDSVEPNEINEVTIGTIIGTQVWMTENLNVDTFRNGDPIPEAKTDEEWKKSGDNGEPAWCYYNNNPNNGNRYGKLYNWYAVNDSRGLSPEGWHVPSDEEWSRLTDFLGGDSIAGIKMKSTTGWEDDGESVNGTNESGFSGLPGGIRFLYYLSSTQTFIEFSNIFTYGLWWSSTEDTLEDGANIVRYLYMYYFDGIVYRDYVPKGCGLSVRCLRD